MEAKCTVKYAFNKMTDEFLHGVAKTLLDFLLARRVALLFNACFLLKYFSVLFALLNNLLRYQDSCANFFLHAKENN